MFDTPTHDLTKHIITQLNKDPKTNEAYTYAVDSTRMYYYLEAKMERSSYKVGTGSIVNYREDNGVQYLYITNYKPTPGAVDSSGIPPASNPTPDPTPTTPTCSATQQLVGGICKDKTIDCSITNGV